MCFFTCRSTPSGVKAAIPQSDKCGFISSSSKIFADLKFRCTIAGRHTSCKYLHKRIETGIFFTFINPTELDAKIFSSTSISVFLKSPSISSIKPTAQFQLEKPYSRARAAPKAILIRMFQEMRFAASSDV